MSLRRKIEKSEWLAARIAAVAGWYLGLCDRRINWQTEGLKDLQDALAQGPVLLVMWHSRSVMGALHWPVNDGPLSSLHDASPVGRVSGALQRRVGLQPMQMARNGSNRAASRMVLKRAKEGVSIGMTGDGPLGPALQVKDAPIDWARATGMPVFCYAFSAQKGRRLKSWDQMLVPRARGKGAYVFARFTGQTSRKMTPTEIETLRHDLHQFMCATTARADALLGLPPGP
ncbi:hypothetical protein SAMN04488005_3251 [Yoonia tamlensis]|uniref:DUF374 domain-containing protein n=1 Tax=Yoonia tamlensis TaxID=390270 RepID=A0A1I6I3J9_9RHOB|nr:hypothetical protein [Yoonia tamlensis]SFR61273.1 hypothetical protein SAMN04488005_3251 [Yoonia tamlensis]